MPVRVSRKLLLAGSALAGVIATGTPSGAQTTLPDLNVSAPSPIVRRPPPALAVTVNPVGVGEAIANGVLPIVGATYAPVTVVTAGQLQRAPGATLGDALADKPGIAASTFAPGASRPVIRGLDNYRVRVQENGVGSMDVSDLSEDHGVPIDPIAAERVEVIRGPATLRWGSTAIGGVVSVDNNRVPPVIPEKGYSIISKGAATTVDNGLEGATAIDVGGGNVAVHVDASKRKADDYRIPGGVQRNTAFDTESYAAGGSVIGPNGFIGVAVTQFNSLYHIPGIDAAERNARIDLKQTKIISKGEIRPEAYGIDAIRFWLGTTDYKHNELGLGGEENLDGIQATFKNKEHEGRVEVQLMPFDLRFAQLTTALGVQVGKQQLSTSGEAGGLLAPADTRSIAGYIFNELHLTPTLRLQAAGRLERVNVSGTAVAFPMDLLGESGEPAESASDRIFTPKSASLGVVKELPWGMFASVTGQYVERAPRAPEMFSKGPHDATGTFEIGDPNLGIESAKTIEIGLRRPKGSFRFDATAFYTRYSNFIFKQLTGIHCGDEFSACGLEDELTQIVYSQRDATFTGAEFIGQLDLMPIGPGIFGIDGQYDIVRARFADGTNVPRIPPQRVGGGVFWRSDAFFARVGLLHAFAQNDIAEHETPTAGYNLLKAELAYNRAFKDNGFGPREFSAGIVGTNLLDDDVRNHVSFKKDEVLQPGRGAKVYARVRF